MKYGYSKEERLYEREVFQIRTDEIRPNRAQPRSHFDQNALIRLTDSIRRYGIMQPLSVRRLPVGESDLYELIAGERRLRAAKLLGLFTVPCVILEVDERISAEMAMIENLLREDLNMFEQASGFRRLIEVYHLTQDEVARKLSMSQSAVANKLRLLRLSYEAQRLILDGMLTERHARALLKLKNEEQRLEVIRHAVEYHLNVQETEAYVEALLKNGEEPAQIPEKATSEATLSPGQARTKELLASLRRRVRIMNADGIKTSMVISDTPKGVSVTIHIERDSLDDVVSRETIDCAG